MAKGFEMDVLAYDAFPDTKAAKQMGFRYTKILKELLQNSDIITLHTPYNKKTHHLVNSKNIKSIKKGALLVNTARGPVVDEHDLVDALRSGQLGGAALDVFDNEPNVNPELINMENVILTPHIASATWEARIEMGRLAVDAILLTLRGEKPSNLVNPEVWDHRRQ